MTDGTDTPAAIVILGQRSLDTARRIQALLPEGTRIHGLAGRVEGADVAYEGFGETLRGLHRDGVPLIALCASGIVIRALAPLLQNKRLEPPVLAVAEDGSAVVPLLGGLHGVNALARRIGAALDVVPAITTTGDVRFSVTLEAPPAGYVARDPGASKAFMSDLLGGASVRLEGEAPWLAESRLPFTPDGDRCIRVSPDDRDAAPGDLVFHPKTVVVAVAGQGDDLAESVPAALAAAVLAPKAVAAVLAPRAAMARPDLHRLAVSLDAPVRFVAEASDPTALVAGAVPEGDRDRPLWADGPVALAVARTPEAVRPVGHPRGHLAVVGLGPGSPDLLAPAAREVLRRADHWIGYETYIRMAERLVGTARPDQAVHASDNRVEMDRARHALALAADGARVAVISSGDPGIFAMATAVMEALHAGDDPAWQGVALEMVPGITAAQAAAARIGAPLGHDFCILSLSDNLKPLDVILERLEYAARADLAMALYNPVSKARPWQLGQALDRLRTVRGPETPVVLARDVARPDEAVRVTTLGAVRPEDADMRTVILIGSSATQTVPRALAERLWVYSPRWYARESDPASVQRSPAVMNPMTRSR
ncbi:precorrin-3B C(17)-methyltransferase [Roseospira marina]|uniref:Precorrin-3B C(17)-methyltransferase n=1 Tax=Roseospira marina TaxID=140057 RepID=A0A5M6ID46_9PROT|nr:precorrin-3B C(17)-methyltransferase [Roseospira marina]KAA5606186.1 precorrin-3B C(17)-methyltransferase [Roseospira marina]MBB4314330.1 cobalt-precorrin 5A hydrolase/precorrin-3B C17-methyltransferase [Roseospira marina]MBB5087490.1 cobalt-precorrin 5A hydrolase/precorrin-3B C17-methyltransferase [Roseospira marina]